MIRGRWFAGCCRDEAAGWTGGKSSRMARKMMAIGRMARGGATRVVIADGRTERPVADALADRGTVVA